MFWSEEEFQNIEELYEDGDSAWYIAEKDGEWFGWEAFSDVVPQFVGHSKEEAISVIKDAIVFWKTTFGV